MLANKIFGIGMPKTGTSSLHEALTILGFRSLHFAHDLTTIAELEGGIYKLSILNHYDAIMDTPIPAIFAQLDSAWPGSKFILTVRDMESWLSSCQDAFFNAPSEAPSPNNFRYFYRSLLYGCIAYNPERFAWVYKSHMKLVMDHFSSPDKRKQLLVLDIAGGEGWEKLCPFLGVPITNQIFPHANAKSASLNK